MDPVALGRGYALLASAALHAGLLAAAGFAIGPSRSVGAGAEPQRQRVFVHLHASPAADAREEPRSVAPAPVSHVAATGRDGVRTASVAASGARVEPAEPDAGPLGEAVPLPMTVAVASEAARATRERHRDAAETQPGVAATVAAAYLRAPEPEYPPRARDEGLEGLVVLRVRISRLGEPAEIRVATSSGHRLLDRAAEAAVARWHFRPARRGDEAVEAWMEVPIRFRLQQG